MGGFGFDMFQPFSTCVILCNHPEEEKEATRQEVATECYC